MHDSMHVWVEVSPGIVSSLFKDIIGGKQGRCFRLEMIPGTVHLPVQELRCLRGMLSLTSKDPRADQHVNRALIREEAPEERESQSLLGPWACSPYLSHPFNSTH